MKKLFLTGAFALLGAVAVNAQSNNGHFKLGAHLGLPTGDYSEAISLNAGVDVAYVWRVAPSFDLGLTSGVSFYPVKSDYGDITPTMIPLAATGQYNFGSGPFIGLDLGYAFFTNEGADGGFLYQPKVGYTFAGKNDLYLSYKGVSQDGGSFGSINLGYAYNF